MTSDFARQLIDLLPRLRRFARALAGADAADDLVQSACERALRAQGTWQPGTRLDSWLFQIIRNLWIDGLRSRGRAGPREAIDDVPELIGDDGRRITEASLTLQNVRRAMGDLPPEQREVLVLVCVEELSYRETADVLSIPIGTVMSRLSRARRAVSLAMDGGGGTDHD